MLSVKLMVVAAALAIAAGSVSGVVLYAHGYDTCVQVATLEQVALNINLRAQILKELRDHALDDDGIADVIARLRELEQLNGY